MSNQMPIEEIVEILLVEDSLPDIELTKQVLLAGRVANHLHVVRDGEQALAFLRRQKNFADAPRPDLILLDLNLPRKSGHEVLREIKADGDLKPIPVVVLTTSASETDIVKAYTEQANSYLTKPVDFHQFAEVINGIAEYWFVLVKLPPRLE